MKFYLTFGQEHVHRINGRTFDKDTLVEIEAEDYPKAREIAFDTFGNKFFTVYPYSSLKGILRWYPEGITPLERKEGRDEQDT